MGKYGFVYLWYDRKHQRFYIGCHWGREDDSYICSSTWMRNAYKRRPKDFKRRILSKIYTNQNDLLEEEYRWLSFINPSELGKKYYNHSIRMPIAGKNGCGMSEETKKKIGDFSRGKTFEERYGNRAKIIKEKLSIAGKNKVFTKQHRENIKNAHIGKTSPNKGKPMSVEQREKISKAHIGKKHSEETKRKMSEARTKR